MFILVWIRQIPPSSSCIRFSQNASSFFCSYKHEPCMFVKQYHLFLLCISYLLLPFLCQTQQFRNSSDLLISNTTGLPQIPLTSYLLHKACLVCHIPLHFGVRSCHMRLEPCGDWIGTCVLFEGFGVFHPFDFFPSSSDFQLCQKTTWESHTPRASHSAFNFCMFNFLCIAGFWLLPSSLCL